jgi:manganese-dependent inorganic pyrophosphatase
MAKETIYVIGHKSPDTDSVCSAIAYSEYLKKIKKLNTAPAIAGEINPETKYVLERFGFKTPQILTGVSGQKLILVDHNERNQSPDGIENAAIIEVLDHHKISFELGYPVKFHAEPAGSTATLVAKILMSDKKYKMTPQTAGLLLSAILSDTVVFKSATTTKEDIEVAKTLAKKSRVKDLKKFGIEIKEKKASLKGLTADQIIKSDFKEFEAGGKKFGIGQIEVVKLDEAKSRKAELLKRMEEIKTESALDFVALMETDIIKEGSELLVSGNLTPIEKAFGVKLADNSVYFKGMMSRKKDLLPPLMEKIKK